MSKDLKAKNAEKAGKIKYNNFPLTKMNFLLMGISGLMIVIGFLLILGEPSGVEFNPDIFSTRRVVVGPTLAFLGFVFMAFAIIYKKRDKKNNAAEDKKEGEI